MSEELPLCECGCGKPVVKKGNRFINHHANRGRKFSEKARKNMSESQKEYHKNNLNAGSEHSKKLVQFYIDNPEVREAARLKTIDQMSDPNIRNAISKKSIEVWDDPDVRNAASKRMIEKWKDSEYRNNQILALKQYFIDNPEACDRASKARLNSEAAKLEYERQQGGLDLVWHHVAYDFGRPEALKVLITRKFHSLVHHPKGIQFHQRGYSLID